MMSKLDAGKIITEAKDHILASCSHIGSFHGTTDVNRFMNSSANEMDSHSTNALFPDRYLEYIIFAIRVISSNKCLSPPSAISSLFLCTRFELYFRILSGVLNADGTWISPSARTRLKNLTSRKLPKKRISNVDLAYEIMTFNSSNNVVKELSKLDKALNAKRLEEGTVSKISSIGNRIKHVRHQVSHGELADSSAEAIFYSLLTIVIFFSYVEDVL